MASNRSICACPMTFLFNVDGVSRCAAQPIKTGTQLIFPVLRIGDFFCVFVRYQIVINCVFSYFNWVITQIRSLIKVLQLIRIKGMIKCVHMFAYRLKFIQIQDRQKIIMTADKDVNIMNILIGNH